MNKHEMEKSIDCIVAETFNHVFYEKRLSHSVRLTLEQNLVATYLADNINNGFVARAHYGRAVFASFAKHYLRNGKLVDDFLRLGLSSIEFRDDVNTDPLVVYCIGNMKPSGIARLNKSRVCRDPLRDLEPNNSAIMAGFVYKTMFRNKNLLSLVRKARDAQDLRALLFIDYMFRSTRSSDVQQILNNGYCIEHKALRLARLVKRRYDAAIQRPEVYRQERKKRIYMPPPLPKKKERTAERAMSKPVALPRVEIPPAPLQLGPVEVPKPLVFADNALKLSSSRRVVQQRVIPQEVYERQIYGLLDKVAMFLYSKRRAVALAAGISVYLGFPI
jgi:hypothetical protein